MELKEILSISGKAGLFKIVAQTKNGVIVESLLDKKRIPAYSNDKIGNLEEISVYTVEKELPLKDVFKTIFEKHNGGKSIDPKAENNVLKSYFEEVLPDYDKEKVYCSDMKKIISWYNLLHENNMLNFDEKVEESIQEEAKKEEAITDEKKEDAPVAEKKEKKPTAAKPKKPTVKKETKKETE